MNKTLLLAALVSASAFAQETPPPPPEAPPPAPVAVAPVADAPVEDPGGRVRWGVSAGLGWHLPQSAFTVGAEGRIGYQISNMFGAYAVIGGTGGFGIGGSVSGSGASVSITALSYWYLGGIAELMLGNLFYVGGGPVLANGALAGVSTSASTSGASVTTVVAAGWKPGLDLRLGLGFGKPRPGSFRRGGFNLGVDALILFHPDAIVGRVQGSSNGTAGVEVKTTELAVTVTPMLTFGYDAR